MPPTSPTIPVIRTGMKSTDVEPVPVKGNPNITKLVHYENFAGGYLVGMSIASHQPGEACGEHSHRGAIEQFYVLGGYGIITIDGEKHYVQTGDSVLVPAGAVHDVQAAPREDSELNTISTSPFVVQCVLVVAPGHEGDGTPWAGVSWGR